MFCNRCGKTISKESKFCVHCGNKITLITPDKNRTNVIDDKRINRTFENKVLSLYMCIWNYHHQISVAAGDSNVGTGPFMEKTT